MPSDAAWQGSRSSVEKKEQRRWRHHKSNKSSLSRPRFKTPGKYFGGGGTTRPPRENNLPNLAKLNFPWNRSKNAKLIQIDPNCLKESNPENYHELPTEPLII